MPICVWRGLCLYARPLSNDAAVQNAGTLPEEWSFLDPKLVNLDTNRHDTPGLS